MRRPSPCKIAIILAAWSVLLAGTALADAAEKPNPEDMRLLRRPDIHGDRIVFSYAGDLWLVASNGGEARRLTATPGYLSFPKFSPDGTQIAFTGNYDGNDDIYVMPAGGGEPVRLTYHPSFDRVIDWQPDGKAVRFQSMRESHAGQPPRLYTVSSEGGLPEAMILPTGGLSSYAPDGKQFAYNRKTREHRTWKRYQGGMAQDIWIYDFDRNHTSKITQWVGTDSFPMWYGQTIYFLSDRTGRLQIWAHDIGSGQQRQVTDHPDYDVKWPSLGDGQIVYEYGGWLYVLDLASERTRKVTVAIHADNVLARPTLKEVEQWTTSGDLAPDAKRAVFAARGDIFTVPAEKGNVRNLTQTPGIRERDPVWSPDGKTIAYLSDESGEYEVYLRPADGKGEPQRLTTGAETYKMTLAWSPDSKWLLMNDADLSLWLVDAGNGRQRRIDQSPREEISQFCWSHDSNWIAYSLTEANNFNSIFVYGVHDGEVHRITSEFTNDTQPCFDDEGNYLFFASAQHFSPTLGGYDLKPLWTNMDGIYLVTLRDDVANPFPPESDEVGGDDDDAKEKTAEENGAGDADKGDEPQPFSIDFAGIEDRMVALDVTPGNFRDLQYADGKLFYLNRPFSANVSRGEQRAQASIHVYDLEERKAETVLGDVIGYQLSADGKKLLYGRRQGGQPSFGIIDAAADQKPAEKPLRTGEMQATVDPRAEWRQMFAEAWRLERDFFYDPDMHQVDWPQMRERYGELVPYVGHPTEFSYLLGEMIGELNVSHSYVRPGERPDVKTVAVGLLGCDFALDADTDRYRLVNILTEPDWNQNVPAPLNIPGSEVAEGDYLLAVDGVELRAPLNPYALLVNKAGKQVTLTIAPTAADRDRREVVVEPIESERNLRYEAWVLANRRKVDELSGGKIGYLHLPNTAIGGQIGFARGYYPQLRKEGLIIDERYNAGGFIPDFIMNVLRQRLVNLWKPRYGLDWRTPHTAFPGHLAMISNGYAGSGGDALPFYFKAYELGPVIGMRTWGGLVGIARNIGLMDGGAVTFPEFGLFNLDGQFDVENHGVEPTIEVDNLPHEVIAGRDPQLEKTVEVLLQRIAAEPVVIPSVRSFPRDRN